MMRKNGIAPVRKLTWLNFGMKIVSNVGLRSKWIIVGNKKRKVRFNRAVR